MQLYKRATSRPGVDGELIDACAEQSVKLLERNLGAHGILAASPSPAAEARSYTRIFGRDAAICAIAMLDSDSPGLQAGALASLDALAGLQADNGQIPKYVDPDGEGADFWYLGCIDATLWWLVAAHHARRRMPEQAARWRRSEQKALAWLLCQEHQRFFLLQQNEASDWADIMPRSGFVLYSNALWHHVKRLYELPRQEQTHYHFNNLFYPFGRELPEYRRARLLRHYVRQKVRRHDMYLSFVNLAFFGEEGDVFGNLLSILCGLAGDSMAQQIVKSIDAARAAEPYPVRVTCEPIAPEHPLWRSYMSRHQQNLEFQYHNGGIWPFVGGFWVMALSKLGKRERAWAELEKLAQVNSLDDWRFTEWFHGETLAPMGMAGQSWNAATFLMALRALEGHASPL